MWPRSPLWAGWAGVAPPLTGRRRGSSWPTPPQTCPWRPPSSGAPSSPGTPRSRWCRCLRGGSGVRVRLPIWCPPPTTEGCSPSSSTSSMMASSSSLVGFCPNILITVPSSLVLMSPPPSASNMSKAALNSVGKGVGQGRAVGWSPQQRDGAWPCALAGSGPTPHRPRAHPRSSPR